jgi:ribosomal protein S17
MRQKIPILNCLRKLVNTENGKTVKVYSTIRAKMPKMRKPLKCSKNVDCYKFFECKVIKIVCYSLQVL